MEPGTRAASHSAWSSGNIKVHTCLLVLFLPGATHSIPVKQVHGESDGTGCATSTSNALSSGSSGAASVRQTSGDGVRLRCADQRQNVGRSDQQCMSLRGSWECWWGRGPAAPGSRGLPGQHRPQGHLSTVAARCVWLPVELPNGYQTPHFFVFEGTGMACFCCG